jgi:hypothetical protein
MIRAGLLAAAMALLASGCLVNGQCYLDDDCHAPERCTAPCVGCVRQCLVECAGDQDCWPEHIDNGKRCVANRCEFRFDERVAALGFCEKVVNPNSGKAGQELCLPDLKGKVVLLYFGWVT